MSGPWHSGLTLRRRRARGRSAVLVLVIVAGCAGSQSAAPIEPTQVVPLVPVSAEPRRCQDVLPLGPRTVSALHQLLKRMSPGLTLAQRDCRKGDAWPIAYATGEAPESGRPPIGFEVLHMTGDALLTFDDKNRESPAVNLCRQLDFTLDPRRHVRAVALWDSDDERAFDAAHPERSSAQLAWVELLSRGPSECALGRDEPEGQAGEAALRPLVACAQTPLVLAAVPACAPAALDAPAPLPDALAVEQAVAANHRTRGSGRAAIEPPRGLDLTLERPELCLYEPPPATRDVCLAEYTAPTGERWYGRGDVQRTGTGGVKNFVDSYLTFILLKRIQAERRDGAHPAPADSGRKK